MRLDLLGGFRASTDSGLTLTLPRRKAQAILAYLGLRPGVRRSRETVIGLLWADVPQEQARHSLRQTLFDLRRTLPRRGSAILLTEGDAIALDPRRIMVDVVDFERLATQSTGKAHELAAALYAGDLLAGLALREPAFEDWLRAERDRLQEMAMRVLRQLLADQIAHGALESAVQTAMRILALDPLQEPVHRALMEIYSRQGRRTAVLRQYDLCVEVLQRELGVAPDVETRRLYRTLAPGPPGRRREERPGPLPGSGRASAMFDGH